MDDPWVCRVCKKKKPVVTLARSCEQRDARELGVDLEELLEELRRTP